MFVCSLILVVDMFSMSLLCGVYASAAMTSGTRRWHAPAGAGAIAAAGMRQGVRTARLLLPVREAREDVELAPGGADTPSAGRRVRGNERHVEDGDVDASDARGLDDVVQERERRDSAGGGRLGEE